MTMSKDFTNLPSGWRVAVCEQGKTVETIRGVDLMDLMVWWKCQGLASMFGMGHAPGFRFRNADLCSLWFGSGG